MNDLSHKTAITRSKISVPMRKLIENDLLTPEQTILDYGCGKGSDAQFLLEKGFDMSGYDPYFFPRTEVLKDEFFDVVTCNYVLNVIKLDSIEEELLQNIKRVLKPGGIAYITVRRDVKQDGYTSKGTYQRDYKFQMKHETVAKFSGGETVRIQKEDLC